MPTRSRTTKIITRLQIQAMRVISNITATMAIKRKIIKHMGIKSSSPIRAIKTTTINNAKIYTNAMYKKAYELRASLPSQEEVRSQAQNAMGAITRSLREVEDRSLRCLEREMALQRREARLEERENTLRVRERRAREMREAIAELEEMPPLATPENNQRRKQRMARNMRTAFPFPAMTQMQGYGGMRGGME